MEAERLDELLWELIDGEISSEDRFILQEYLVGRPEAEERRRELVSLANQLDTMPILDPPPGLRERIDTALAIEPEAAPSTPPLRMPPPTAAAWPMRAAYLAAGLLMGAALTFLVVSGPGGDLDQSKLYGTVQRGLSAGGTTVELEAGGGTLRVDRRGATRLLDLELRRPGPVEIELAAASNSIRLDSLDQDGSAGLAASVEGDRLSLRMSGPARLRLSVDVGAGDATLGVIITAVDERHGAVSLFSGELVDQ